MEPYRRTSKCLYCHEPFTFMQGTARPKVYCSTTCQKECAKTGDRRCQLCGTDFRYEYGNGMTTACSEACKAELSERRCLYCHEPKYTTNALDQYCSLECQSHAPKHNCEYCGKETHARRGTLRNNPRFCNQDCRTAWIIDHRPEASKKFRNPRLEAWINKANDAEWPTINGPLEREVYPFYTTMPYGVNPEKLSYRMKHSIGFWETVGIPYLAANLADEEMVVYYVSHGRLPIDMNYRMDLNNTASLWELTPWLYHSLVKYDFDMMRQGTNAHSNEVKKLADKIWYLMPAAETFNRAVRMGELGRKRPEVKRTLDKGIRNVNRMIEAVKEYRKMASRLTTTRGLREAGISADILPETNYYEYFDDDLPEYAVTQAHNEIATKWMMYRQSQHRLGRMDTPTTVGEMHYRALNSAVPDTLEYYVDRWHGATVDVVGNIVGLAFEPKSKREAEEDWE